MNQETRDWGNAMRWACAMGRMCAGIARNEEVIWNDHPDGSDKSLKGQMKTTFLMCLDKNQGNVAKTARDLQVPNSTAHKWMKKWRSGACVIAFLALLSGCTQSSTTPVSTLKSTVEPVKLDNATKAKIMPRKTTLETPSPERLSAVAVTPVPSVTNITIYITNHRSNGVWFIESSTNLLNWKFRTWTSNDSVKLPNTRPVEYFRGPYLVPKNAAFSIGPSNQLIQTAP